MTLNIYKWLVALMAIGPLSGCSSVKPTGVTAQPEQAEVTLDPSSRGTVKMKLRVPVEYLSVRERLLITPRLVTSSGEVAEVYDPVAVDAPVYAKKMHRKEVLEGYVDSLPKQVIRTDRWSKLLEVPYETAIHVPEGMDDAHIDALVAVEGCATCENLDTLFVANLLRQEPIDTFSLRWIRPLFTKRPKLIEGKGVAALQFVINQADIDASLGNNRAELEKMQQKLGPILSDSLATIHAIHIVGMASADGPYAFNTSLAHRRAMSAKQWLLGQLAIAPETEERVLADVRPEGWLPVLEAMREADDPCAADVEAILKRVPAVDNNDDQQERAIRRLSCWERIRTHYLQRDRKVEYRYSYTLKSFTTDGELLQMYALRPDAFSEEEFLHVAELKTTLDEKIEVYRKLLAYYPDSEIGKNNLAVLEHDNLPANRRKGGAR